jgi:hypothetical protein
MKHARVLIAALAATLPVVVGGMAAPVQAQPVMAPPPTEEAQPAPSPDPGNSTDTSGDKVTPQDTHEVDEADEDYE